MKNIFRRLPIIANEVTPYSRSYRLLVIIFFFAGISIAENSNSFSFAQICDTQLGFGKSYSHDVEAFKQSVEKINKLNPDFVVICGDLVNSSGDQSFSDFKEINKSIPKFKNK